MTLMRERLKREENEMEIDMLCYELEDAYFDSQTNTEEGAAFGKANVAPASASLVNHNTLFEPFDIGQSRTYHNLKTNKDGKPRLDDGAAVMEDDTYVDPKQNTQEGDGSGKAYRSPAELIMHPFVQPFVEGRTRVFLRLKPNEDGKPRLYDGAAFMKEALNSSKK